MNVDYSAFEGWPLEGRPSVVTVRGKVQVRDGKFVGEQARGQMLKARADAWVIFNDAQKKLRRTRRKRLAGG